MAFPIILVDSGGSDTQASGAGPATALFGSTGVVNATATEVDLSADSPDLSGVATDGSAAIFFSDGTAGNRNFSKITGVNNSTKIVTVSEALRTFSGGKSWAIGGKRASIGSATSRLLFENAGAVGDAMPGWVIQLVSGHTETLTDRLLFRRSGDTTSGSITLRGEPGAATLPILTWNTNDIALYPLGAYNHVHDLGLKNTNGTKTASEAIRMQSSNGGNIRGVNFNPDNDSGNAWFRDINITGEAGVIEGCKFGLTADDAIRFAIGASFSATIRGNFFNDVSGVCINCAVSSVFLALTIEDNLFYNCAVPTNIFAANSAVGRFVFVGNTIDGAGSQPYGLWCDNTNLGWIGAVIENNSFSNLTTEALHFDDLTLAMINAYGIIVRGNNFYNVTSKYNVSGLNSENELTVDPQFTNAAGLNLSVGLNLKAQAWPAGASRVVAYSATRTYKDIGATQRQEAGGGGAGMRGGFVN
jgi:hypothetical protein